MKKKIIIGLLSLTAVCCAGTAIGCSGGDEEKLPVEVVNGGFETGDLSGWTVEYGDAYDDDSVSSRRTFSYSADVDPHGYVIPINQTGNWYLSGKGFDNARPSTRTGAIRSDNFVLTGDGTVSMKLAGGAQATSRSDTAEQKPLSQVCYVGIYRASDNKMIASQTNRYFAEDASNIELEDYQNGTCYTDNFCQYKIELADYIGEELYIRIVDNDTSYYYGYLSVDDIRIGKSAEPQSEGAYFTKSANRSEAEQSSIYEIANGGFETGSLAGWEIKEGLAFSDDGVNCDPFWWAEQIPYERDGNYHYGYYNPTAVGVMRSSVFTVGGSGFVTYKLGGCRDNNSAYLRFIEIKDGGEEEEIFTVSNFAFKDMQFPNVANGLRVINLNQYRVDLSAYAGRQFVIEAVDNNSSSDMAGCIVLDSVITYHQTKPQFTDWFDVVTEVREEIPENEFQVRNGGFETGDFTGWTMTGEIGVITDDSTWWVEKLPYNKSGKFHFSGMCYDKNDKGEPIYDRVINYEMNTGTLTSEYFTVGGRGIMTFKLGGAYDPRFSYISLINDRDEEVARYSNYMFADRGLGNINRNSNVANMVDYRADLTRWYGQRLKIRLCDFGTSNWGLLIADSFITYYTDNDINRFPEKTFEAVNLLGFEERASSPYQIENGNFERGNLDGWEMNGNIGNVSYEYLWWDQWYTFNKEGLYLFSGFSGNEGDRGTLTSSPFTVAGSGYITYLLGGGKNPDLCYLEVVDAENPQKVYCRFANDRYSKVEGSFTGVPVTVGCEGFGANMNLYKADISKLMGHKVRLRLVDNATGDWGLLFADDFITYYADKNDLPSNAYTAVDILGAPDIESAEYDLNLAYKDEVALKLLNGENGCFDYLIAYNENAAEVKFNEFNLKLYFDPEGKIENGFEKTYKVKITVRTVDKFHDNKVELHEVEITVNAYFDDRQINNGDFETGDLTGWTVVEGNVHYDKAVSGMSTFWGEDISYNQGGNYHFDGWQAQFAEEETYALQSSLFTLSGSGYISFKMGGRSAVFEVYKKDGTRIAVYENTAFSDEHFPHIDEGCMLATMQTYVADLSDYIGEELYIRILDGKEGGEFGIAMFDDIVTYYETAPDVENGKDIIRLNSATSSTGEAYDYELKWQTAVNILENN